MTIWRERYVNLNRYSSIEVRDRELSCAPNIINNSFLDHVLDQNNQPDLNSTMFIHGIVCSSYKEL